MIKGRVVTTHSLVVIVKANSWLLGAFDCPLCNRRPCVCAQLVILQRVAKEDQVVWLNHLR